MLTAFLSAVLCLQPYAPVIADRCDFVELNHCFNDDGQLSFTQVVAWEWSEVDGAYHVAGYRVLHGRRVDIQRGKEFKVTWLDPPPSPVLFPTQMQRGELFREIAAPAFRETWSQVDPELEDRRQWPESNRRELGARP